MHPFEYPRVAIPQCKYNQCQHPQLDTNPPFGIILLFSDGHDGIDHEKVVGVQWTDVVEEVGIAMSETEEEDEEVEPPKHLEESGKGVVVCYVEEGKVS